MAGSYSGRSSSSRTSRRRRRQFPCGDMLAAPDGPRKVRISYYDPRHCRARRRWQVTPPHLEMNRARCAGYREEGGESGGGEHYGGSRTRREAVALPSSGVLTLDILHRQAVWRLSRPLARQVGRVPARLAQERRVQRRCQGSGHGKPDRQAYPSQPGPQATTTDIPCPRSGMQPQPCPASVISTLLSPQAV